MTLQIQSMMAKLVSDIPHRGHQTAHGVTCIQERICLRQPAEAGASIRITARAFRVSDRTLTGPEPDGLRRVAGASVLKDVIDLECHSTSKYVSMG